LSYTLDMLSKQTHQDFTAWFIINNADVRREAEDMIGAYPFTHSLCNAENRGPFARVEVIHQLKDEHEFFMTIDDDLIFTPTLLADWWAVRNANAVQGWKGFEFVDGDYWKRTHVADGVPCNYVWGSNMFLPAAAVRDYRIQFLDERWWQCDDLWLCYWANHRCGMDIMQQSVNVSIDVDGKDSYFALRDVKVDCLRMLIAKGWAL